MTDEIADRILAAMGGEGPRLDPKGETMSIVSGPMRALRDCLRQTKGDRFTPEQIREIDRLLTECGQMYGRLAALLNDARRGTTPPDGTGPNRYFYPGSTPEV